MAFPTNPNDGTVYYNNGIYYKYNLSSKCWLKDIDDFTGATSTSNGASGLVPKPTSGQQDYIMTGGGFKNPYSTYNPVDVSRGTTPYVGSYTQFSRADHKHRLIHNQVGFDLCNNVNPYGTYTDLICTSGSPGSSSVYVSRVPWVYANIDEAERSLPYWIQKLTTFFKNLENDTQYDQLIGFIPSVGCSYGSFGVSPGSTDCDNQVSGSTAPFASETFVLIVGKNSSNTAIYTMEFKIGLNINTNTYPFRMIYQETRNGSLPTDRTLANGINSAKPRCSQYGTTYTAPAGYFPICFDPITIEIRK